MFNRLFTASLVRRIGRCATIGALSVVAVLGLGGTAMASTHNVMIVGASIPAQTKSIMVAVSSGSRCLAVTPGVDRNTGLSVQNGGFLVYQLFELSDCDGDAFVSQGANVPEQMTTSNFWLRVS